MFARRRKTRDVEADAATQSRWLGPGAKAVALTVLLLAAAWYGRGLIVPPPTDESLAQAAALGDYDGVARALRAGISVNGGNGVARGGGPLLLAATAGDERVVELLLRHGADPACTTFAGYTPLMTAALHGNGRVVQLLLDAGADPNQPTSSSTTALGAAAGSGNVAAMELLLARGADPRGADVRGSAVFHEPPLLCAIRASESAAIVARLIEAGADVNVVDNEGMTPLCAAAEVDRADLVQLLLRTPPAAPH